MALARHSLAAAAAVLGAPVGGLALVWRPDWRPGLAERLGILPRQPAGSIWLHGASVGESRLVGRMASALAARGHRPFATLQTVAGRGVLRDAQPALPCALAPLDHPWCVDRALARVRPAGLVLIETELWPVWIAACARTGVPVGVVSGRISDRAWPRYRRVARLMRFVLSRVSRVGARSARDAERFVALGADPDRVDVTGDLKWAHAARRSEVDGALRCVLHGRRVFVAGSTHPGEEQIAVEALARAERAGHAPVLIVAPRHLDRADAVARALVATGRSVRRRSRLGDAPLSDGEVLLLDTLGELRGLYGLACL
ncbi:MAG TPA: 3-deoxy-D-manno-octulosonic acid transferase, partial [Alphaproteobacteria bacterium]|nr:3-deoxy-D-manno-octulosonic acid transferase [Alphaproteobacteria bacterium]